MGSSFQTLLRLDAKLEKGGIPPLSDWWKEQAARFYAHPSATLWAGRIGRGGSKSTTGVKVALNETIHSGVKVPRGERHYFAIVSENVTEAQNRLGQLAEYLTVLGIPHARVGDAIELTQERTGFRVFACRVGAVSGFRCFGWLADEAAKWRNADSSANPASDIVGSMNAMCATHAAARPRRMVFSSPLATVDYHYEVVEAGDTDAQIVSYAPSWVANPIVTEAFTRTLERVERIWRREYLAQPTDSVSACFDHQDVEAAYALPERDYEYSSNTVLVLDPSSGRKDTWAYAIGGWRRPVWSEDDKYLWKPALHNNPNDPETYLKPNGKKVIDRDADGHPKLNPHYGEGKDLFVMGGFGGWKGTFHKRVSAEEIVATLAQVARDHAVSCVVADQRENYLLEAAFQRHGLPYRSIPWTNTSKGDAVAWLGRKLRERQIRFDGNGLGQQLKKELLGFREKVMPSGTITWDGRESDDFVALCLTAGMADIHGHFSGSPTLAGGLRTHPSGKRSGSMTQVHKPRVL
jgi:hypothetical protein